MNKGPLLLLILFFSFLGCDDHSEELRLISGNWKGVSLSEEGLSMPLDSNAVSFFFNPELLAYTFSSPLGYREEGTFFLEKKYLFTMDTINQSSSEKMVELIQLSTDSLVLKMQENGRDRILKLVPAPE